MFPEEKKKNDYYKFAGTDFISAPDIIYKLFIHDTML